MADDSLKVVARLESEIMELRSELLQIRSLVGQNGVDAEEDDATDTRTDGGGGVFDEKCIPAGGDEGQSGAFKYETEENEDEGSEGGDGEGANGKITYCHFMWEGSHYKLDDVDKVGDGTWYLKVDKEHPGSSTVTKTTGSPGKSYVLVPLFTIEDGEIVDDYRGMPCIFSEHPELEAGDGIDIEESNENGAKKYTISSNVSGVECDDASVENTENEDDEEVLQVFGFDEASAEDDTIAKCMGNTGATQYLVLAKNPDTGKICYLNIGRIKGDADDGALEGSVETQIGANGELIIKSDGVTSVNGAKGDVELKAKSDTNITFSKVAGSDTDVEVSVKYK